MAQGSAMFGGLFPSNAEDIHGMGNARTVEQYERILSQDPSSPAFIELAKALLEDGAHSRAAEVCQQGIGHHPNSIVGRVIWGTTLIHLGRPADAMAQFDQALSLDRDNPRVYVLIAETLMRKGLYRSALPLLKKALNLRPGDPRLQSWLEQSQAALTGGPAPDLSDVDPNELEALSAEYSLPNSKEVATHQDISGQNATVAPGTDDGRDTTQAYQAYDPTGRGLTGARAGEDVAGGSAGWSDSTQEDPFAHVAGGAMNEDAPEDATQVHRVLPSRADDGDRERDEQEDDAPAMADAGSQRTRLDVPAADDTDQTGEYPASAPPITVRPSGVRSGRGQAEPPTLAQTPVVPSSGAMARASLAAVPTTSSGSMRVPLLADIPEAPEPASSVEVPKVEVSNEATRAIAQEYERELRAKLAATASQKTFLQQHWIKLAVASVVLVALAVGSFAFYRVRARNMGQGLNEALAAARAELAKDAPEKAAEALARAVEMVDSSEEAWALTAYTQALRFSEGYASGDAKAQAEKALTHSGVRERFPEIVLATEFHLSGQDAGRAALVEAILGNDLQNAKYPLGIAAIHELAGRLLLDRPADVEKALKRLDQSFSAVPNVRALLALAEYYRSHSDLPTALDMFEKAAKLNESHPLTVLGASETRLALGLELAPVLEAVDSLPSDDKLTPQQAARRELVRGRALTGVGRFDEALSGLEAGVKKWPSEKRLFLLALGQSARFAGRWDVAQSSLETLLKAKATDEDALEELGRVLIAQDKEKEALRRLEANGTSRKVALVKGIAYARMSDWKKARAELARTKVNDKYPLETVLYLALADAAEGEGQKALEILERQLATARKHRSDIRVALGQVYWQRGALDKAREQFEEASRDLRDWEGKCALGRFLLSIGQAERALEPLTASVSRNGTHADSRHALITALLETGRTDEARDEAKRWLKASPSDPDASRDLAWTLVMLGEVKEADGLIASAVKKNARDLMTARVEAMVQFAKGNSKAAFASLERANSIDSSSSAVFCDIGMAFVRIGNKGNAEKAFGASLREKASAPCGLVGKHFSKLPAGNRAASRELETIAQNASIPAWERAFANSTLSRVLLSVGLMKEARKAADEAVTLAPAAGHAQLALALVALRQKDEAVVQEAFDKAVRFDPTYSAVRLARADWLARSPDNSKEALADYEAFLRLGGDAQDKSRVEKTVKTLKKKVAAR